jgi:phosphate starvation-inducible PhoH-like protein
MKQVFKTASPRKGQQEYYDSIHNNQITLCVGRAGTGKTFLALSTAIEMLYKQSSGIRRVVIIRPYIPTNIGEKLGALPGTLSEKVGPYVEGIKDNLREMITEESEIMNLINNKFEFAVLGTCRGRSFNNAFIIVEEAQNVPLDGGAMKMLLTRIGKKSRMVIAGDLDQCDIASDRSALTHAINVLDGMKEIGIIEMNDLNIIQRNPLIKEILKRYEDDGQ